MITSVTIFAEIVNLRNVLMTFSQALVFFFALLNPFLLSLYLMEIITRFEFKVFIGILTRGVIIAGMIFSMFALTGDAIFSKMLHVDFSSFQIFGGIHAKNLSFRAIRRFLILFILFHFAKMRSTNHDTYTLNWSIKTRLK
jgi:small neutral amino acid transporter SnatA (MarC family)